MKIAYKHLLQFLDENPSEIEVSEKLFQLGHENTIQNGIFDIEFTPNRGDCLSLHGLARDLNVFYTNKNNLKIMEDSINPLNLNFKNDSVEDCPNISFLNIHIEGEISPYKDYLNSFFEELEVKKNNFFTDISNYVAYEIGQPTHCYDFSKIGDLINFKNLKIEDKFHTLLDIEIELSGKNCVFISNEKVINLAGVMGDKSTSCSKETNNVLIECAYFRPESIIGKAIKYDINSDASYKFERGVDPELQEFTLRRFIQIVSDHAKISRLSIYSKQFKNLKRKKVNFDVNNINKILGTNISSKSYSNYIDKLGFAIKNDQVEIHLFRHDIATENDLAEEVARIIGYDNIKPMKFNILDKSKELPNKKSECLKNLLIDHGFNEVINMPFCDVKTKNSVEIINPLDVNKRFLRSYLKDSLVENVVYNENRQQDSIKLFEISDVYNSCDNEASKEVLCLILSGRAGHNYKDFSVKLDKKFILDLFKKANIHLEEKLIKEIPRSEIKSKQKNKIYLLELNIEEIPDSIFKYIPQRKTKSSLNTNYKKVSEFPSSSRDISFLLSSEDLIENLENILLKNKSDDLKNVFVFDFYKKDKNHIKIGFRFIFQSLTKTLTVEAIDKHMSLIVNETLKIDGIEIPGLKNN